MTPAGWLLPWLLLWVLAPDAAAEPDIDVSFDGSRLEFRLDAAMRAPRAQVETVLQDYSSFDRVLPLVVESRSLGEVADGIERIATRMRGCVLFVCREIDHVFDVRAIPGHWSSGITVPELSRIRRGHMAWRIEVLERDGLRSRLQLYGYFEPDFSVPRLFGPPLVRLWVGSELEKSVGRIEEAALALGEQGAPAVEVR